MACVVEITTWLRGNSKDDKAATVLHKKKHRLECLGDRMPEVTRQVKIAANISGMHTKNKEVDGVHYLYTQKSKPIFVSFRMLEGEEAVITGVCFSHEWRGNSNVRTKY
jgi:hypothetical protein